MREAAAKLADDLGPGSVADLDDASRIARLEKPVDATGLADAALRRGVRRRGGHRRRGVRAGTGRRAVPRAGARRRPGRGALGREPSRADRAEPESGRPDEKSSPEWSSRRPSSASSRDEDAGRWRALALAVTCADLVGAARGAHALACDYAKIREQYGATIGSYQAVGHLLAESLALIEGSISVLRHAAWAVDELPAAEAIEAARVAKIYCARAALTVCETSIQVHGGIGNTWECLAHVYLRRVLAATELWPVKLEELSIGLS